MLTIEEIKAKILELNLDQEVINNINEIISQAEAAGGLTQEDREEIANILRIEAEVNRERAALWEEAGNKLGEVEEELEDDELNAGGY